MAVGVAQETLERTGNNAPYSKINRSDINTVRKGRTKKGEVLEEFLISVTSWTELGHIAISLRNRADLFEQVPGGEDEIPASISVVGQKPTWRRDLADFRN
ncbi:hypothetical protein E2C01_096405 [Portunus trituberculatus]|uniref:Uncharacterized protein n=1 Tax=Portunus trituberculatus TaxID=210409 RepID=A0A5B7K1N0_PORTR|nr:hypothetical protein [Portunus trituberculatus]